jgi:hypothetical protein
MNPVTWDETNGYEATRIYRENAVAAVSAVVLSQDGACMAGLKGKSGPPGNMNAFKHGLAAIQRRREESVTTEHEESVRQQILGGLIEDKGGDQQVSTATKILAEVIASDTAWLVVFNGAVDHIIKSNPKVRQNPRGLHQLDGYKRGLVLRLRQSPEIQAGPIPTGPNPRRPAPG